MRARRVWVSFVISLLAWGVVFLSSDAAQAALPKRAPSGEADLGELISADVARRSRPNFLRLYRTLWKSQGMEAELAHAIDTAFDEQTRDLTWGTTGLQLAANRNNIIDDIQDAAASKFAAPYDMFLKELEERWSVVLQNDIIAFYTMSIAQSLATDTNSMSQAWLRQDHMDIVSGSGSRMLEELRTEIQTRYPDLELAGAGVAIGLAGVLFRRKLSQQIGKFFLRKGMKGAAAKAVGAAVPVVNMVMMLWSAYDILSIAWDAESEVRAQLHAMNQSLYVDEVPLIYWDVMEPYVQDIFYASYVQSQRTIEQARELARDPKIISLSEGLTEAERQRFAERVALIVRDFGTDGYDALLQDFGPLIRSASPADFQRLADVLRQGGTGRTKAWIDLAGEARWFDLHASLPRAAWDEFPPTEGSLEILLWMSQSLTPNARVVACSLSPADLHWTMEELPSRYVPRLINERYTTSAIQAEILRLSELPDKDARVPWQGKWAHLWAKYQRYVYAALGLLLLFIVYRIVSGIWSLISIRASTQPSRQRRRRTPLYEYNRLHPQPTLDVEAVPVRALPSRAHRIRLRVDHAVAQQLQSLMWDSSQRIMPDEDGSLIFSVTLEDSFLDTMAGWVARNARGIEIIGPEELREAVRARVGAEA